MQLGGYDIAILMAAAGSQALFGVVEQVQGNSTAPWVFDAPPAFEI